MGDAGVIRGERMVGLHHRDIVVGFPHGLDEVVVETVVVDGLDLNFPGIGKNGVKGAGVVAVGVGDDPRVHDIAVRSYDFAHGLLIFGPASVNNKERTVVFNCVECALCAARIGILSDQIFTG